MPIFEYHCQDCGSDFEKLVRKAGDAVSCPSCGETDGKQANIEIRYSTFAAHAKSATSKPSSAPQPGGCPAGMCRTPGLCGRN
jgi:putative FmdB family regulatory protein